MPSLQDAAIQVAETIQTAHVNKAPSVTRDIAPSTAADTKEPVAFDRSAEIVSDAEADVDEDEVPLSILRPLPPDRPSLHMPLPDLRFEQSYLASIEQANNWQTVAYITVKDQVLMPLVQGMVWTLAVAWWKYWNVAPKFYGQTVGAKIRRWWWNVNNWKIPVNTKGTLRDEKVASRMREFYQGHANAGSD